ncbi:GDSL-type esterase/lipase family protein [Bifidobacterium vansinderenii]|uniref:Rhamnogalacturonan acetylesterase n=1 Tax=Bifidobacterium vansinderenii TaxID=1984871 RepID=A0A229VW33_9BIFI|nr:GDSL-type esterase/lipase family protein [Bifidobacterium vansinderenii]OXM99826.1 rhamnogalacturonan acetylesterase [Bifidobacterium vansinderenii]
MTTIIFTQPYEHAFVRDYPNEAAGWVDGVYERRVPELSPVPEEAYGSDGLAFATRRLVEESDTLNGDPNTIARTSYFIGTAITVPAQSKGYRITAEVVGTDEIGRAFRAIVNGQDVAQFTLLPDQRREIAFDVQLTRRDIELTFVPVEGRDDATTGWGELTLAQLSYEPIAQNRTDRPHIFIAADSTVQTYFAEEAPQAGWGEWLAWFLMNDHRFSYEHDVASTVPQARVFTGDGPTIHNRALGGRGLRSYLDEHRFHKLLGSLAPNDVVLIQFGINDESKTRPMRYIPLDEYAAWLDRYVISVADRGARPVLVTAIPQYPLGDGVAVGEALDPYADVTRTYAAEYDVPLIDLRKLAGEYLAALPEENVDAVFLRASALQYPRHLDGIRDRVHIGTTGAKAYARIVARELGALYPEFAFHDEEQGSPEPVENLTADGVTGIIGAEVNLSWTASPHANYYVVEKTNAEGRVYNREVIIKPEYHDLPLPGQSRHVVYTVTAWRDAVVTEPRRIAVTIPASDDICADLG